MNAIRGTVVKLLHPGFIACDRFVYIVRLHLRERKQCFAR